MKTLGIVVPCYNEQEVLPEAARCLMAVVDRLVSGGQVSQDSRIYFVDDGSTDDTWRLIVELGNQYKRICGIKLAHNQGHQNALLAGLLTAPDDVLVTVDADLQDDVDTIDLMLAEHRRGAEIVYGVRDDRSSDTALKRDTARLFYRVMRLLGVDVPSQHADFRLMGRSSLDALREFREVNLFLRGIVPLIGFQSAIVRYKRQPRFAGDSKYPLRKMISFALEGVTSFSVAPLRFVTITGILIAALSMAMGAYIVAVRLFTDRAVPGWASTVLPIYLLGGVQIFCVGILGEYIGKIYKEVKARPRYIIECVNNM